MSASAILISTVLVVLLVVAVALLAGSAALLTGRGRPADGTGAGLLEALRLLDRQWQIERLVYRRHRLFGLLVATTSVFCLWQLGRSGLSAILASHYPASILAWALLLGQAFNLLVGLVILVRPSLLKPLEALSNRWHPIEARTGRPGAARITAALLALVGLAILLAAGALLLQQINGVAT